MYPEEQGILAHPKKPGPIERAVATSGIAAISQQQAAGLQRQAQAQPAPASAIAADPFAYRGGYPATAPKGPSNGPDSTALDPVTQQPAPVTFQPNRGIAAPMNAGTIQQHLDATMANQGTPAVGKPEVRQTVVTHGAADTAENAGIAAPPIGRNDQGVITADSAQAAMGNPMQRSGGIFGTYDGKGVNEIMARENKIRGEMIDGMITANGGNGIGILGEMPAVVAPMRGHEQGAGIASRPRVANPLADELTKERIQGAQLHNDQTQRLNDLQQQLLGEADPGKRNEIAGQIKALSGRTAQPSQGERLTMPQVRSNFEIQAARKAVSGMTPEEIKRKTANFTATGRENPEYDPTLAKSVSLANRRKYGADDDFDQRQQAQQPEGNDGDVMTRFRADQAMQGHKMGKQTDQGTEVFDASGRLIGHYQ